MFWEVAAALAAFLLCSLTASADIGMQGIERPFTRLSNATNFGPTGARLWATYLINEPGMRGSFEYTHKVNAPMLFGVDISTGQQAIDFDMRGHKWFPSHLETSFAAGDVELRESKFITWDDCAVDIITFTNNSKSDAALTVRVTYGMGPNEAGPAPEWQFTTHGETVYVSTAFSGSQNISLEPGQSIRCTICCALALSETEARDTAQRWLRMEDPLAAHAKQYAAFFQDIPTFECSDPSLQQMWDYRWYLARRNLSDPRLGRLRHPVYYEGRGVKMSLEPWTLSGWEFSKLIPFSTGFHVLEGRWKTDASACTGEILTLVENQTEDGFFPCVYTDRTGGAYKDLVPWSAWQLYLVHPDREWLKKIGTAMVKQVDANLAEYDPDGNFLPEVRNHNKTGKEYQPSFFYNAGYPSKPGKSTQSILERVDAACYLYLNAQASADIMAELGETDESRRLSATAHSIRKAILEVMWDPQRKFFYDVDIETGQRIPVENVVGFDPFFAGIADRSHLAVFERLRDPGQFWTPAPVPSTTKQCPAYAPNASWNGEHLKGEHGAMWNGPTWPFTNSTVLMALGNAAEHDHSLDQLFADILSRYTLMCFRSGDIRDPMIYEHYNPETGKPISEEEDYYHSTWIDLIVRYVAGVTPLPGDCVEFNPVDCGLEHFSLREVKVGSHVVDVEWGEDGYKASVDGKIVDHRPSIRCAGDGPPNSD